MTQKDTITFDTCKYKNKIEYIFTWGSCNCEMYFDLCASPL
jgi:hypothetical protein